jgi:alkylation response protein AidB-like acyl-CoA dehydrogenase
MAGYSGTPLWKKLGIKPGHTVAVLGQPAGWMIEELPEDVVLRTRAAGPLDAIVAFFDRRSEVERRLDALIRALRADGSLWIAWPRKASGHISDISENDLRTIILPTGLVDTKVAALDQDWSGLKFVWRRELRSRVPPAVAR